MKVFKCLISGDEIFTDTYSYELKDGFYRIKGKYVTRTKGDKVDDSLIGGNASAEEPQEAAADESTESGVNVVLDNRLKPTGFGTKKEYTGYLKDYLKALEAKVVENNPSLDTAEWRKEMNAAFKPIVGAFKDLEFYTGESGDMEALMCLVRWEAPEGETDEVPFVYILKDGLKEQKL